ncbi:MAG: DUF6390 family protein [Candidatus Bilamarchaeum sp.]|jgi:hydrogenase maturation factor
MDPTALASFYAFPPNNLGYCGHPKFYESLSAYLVSPSNINIQALQSELKKFPTHYAYLNFIARENGLSPFDLKVVRAFWTGNSLLSNISYDSLKEFIKDDLFAGKFSSRVELLISNLPFGLVPHHSFNSLYIRFVSERVERSVENFDSCCITWGKVLKLSGNCALIDRMSVSYENGFFLKNSICQVDLQRNKIQFLRDISVGDYLSVHWGMAIEKLSVENRDLLEKWTLVNISAINGK